MVRITIPCNLQNPKMLLAEAVEYYKKKYPYVDLLHFEHNGLDRVSFTIGKTYTATLLFFDRELVAEIDVQPIVAAIFSDKIKQKALEWIAYAKGDRSKPT